MTRSGALSAGAEISIREVGVRYQTRKRGVVRAIESVSLKVRPEEMVCVVGPSGCGKSTLLGAVAGLVPYDRGIIECDGRAVSGPGSDRAVVFQQPALLPWKSVLQNAAYGALLHGHEKRQAMCRASEALELVGLSEHFDASPHELSGGMKQRVNLARALACEPRILLLDEPFAALDAQHREILQGELLRIWEAKRNSAMFITHQIDEAVLLGDKVVVFSQGPRATVEAMIDIDLPRPRDRSVRTSVAFGRYVDQIWGHLQFDVGGVAV